MKNIQPVIVNKFETRSKRIFNLINAFTERINHMALRGNIDKYDRYDKISKYNLIIYTIGVNLKVFYKVTKK